MYAWKYIHPVDENTVIEISGTTYKFFKNMSAMLRSSLGFIITPILILSIVLVLPNHNLLSPNLMKLSLRKATLPRLQILPVISKGCK